MQGILKHDLYWQRQHYVLQIGSNRSCEHHFSIFPIDCGIALFSYRYKSDSGGGIAICQVGYFITTLHTNGHNDFGTVSVSGTVSDTNFTVTNGKAGYQFNLDILYPDWNYSL